MSTSLIILPKELRQHVDYLYYESTMVHSIRAVKLATIAMDTAKIQFQAGEFTKQQTDRRIGNLLACRASSTEALKYAFGKMQEIQKAVREEDEYWRVHEPCKN